MQLFSRRLMPKLDRKLQGKPQERRYETGVCSGVRSDPARRRAGFAQRPDRNVDLPIVRSFHWFGYVGGDDIRQACGKDGRNRLRLVYNAIYDEQVRTYEVFLQPDGTAGLSIGVLADQGNVANLSVADPGDVSTRGACGAASGS